MYITGDKSIYAVHYSVLVNEEDGYGKYYSHNVMAKDVEEVITKIKKHVGVHHKLAVIWLKHLGTLDIE